MRPRRLSRCAVTRVSLRMDAPLRIRKLDGLAVKASTPNNNVLSLFVRIDPVVGNRALIYASGSASRPI